MSRYAAFLRAVNLGSVNKASKERLLELFEGAGLNEVQTFRTSGNVVFGAKRETAGALTKRIEAALEDGLGFAVPVFLRTEAEVKAIAAEQPFEPAAVEASEGKLQVMLLLEKPSVAVRRQVLEHSTERDRLAFGPRELFWLPSGRMMDSELDQKAIAKLLGPATQRTMGTVQAIATKFFGA